MKVIISLFHHTGVLPVFALFLTSLCTTSNIALVDGKSLTESPSNGPTKVVPCPDETCGPKCYGRNKLSLGGDPTLSPSKSPTLAPAKAPTNAPSVSPATKAPTANPTNSPTSVPSKSPTFAPTPMLINPVEPLTGNPTNSPTSVPSKSPTSTPTNNPTTPPVLAAVEAATASPTNSPTSAPTNSPVKSPSSVPTRVPSIAPTSAPTTLSPTETPSAAPSMVPSKAPSRAPIPGANCEDRDLDICIAIDMSGSVCSNQVVLSCDDCSCYTWPGYENNKEQCCDNFVKELNFTKTFIEIMDGFESNQMFSLVSFSTNALEVSGLSPAAEAKVNADSLVYKGGWTNTGDAIKACYDTLKHSVNTRAIVVVTDGTATTGEDQTTTSGSVTHNQYHQIYAEGQSENAQDAEILVIPVAVNTISLNVSKLAAIASSPELLVEVANFEDLDLAETVNQLAANVKCGSNHTVMQGSWVTRYHDTFESGWGNWIKEGEGSPNAGLVNAMNVDVHCPYDSGDGVWCIVLRADSLTDNIANDTDVYMRTDYFDVSGSSKVRVQFDYATQNWKNTENDHFHLDYRIDGGDWVDHTYQIAVNFNNAIDGTMEKWFDVPDGAQQIQFRMHIDTDDATDYLFIDNVLVQRFIPTI